MRHVHPGHQGGADVTPIGHRHAKGDTQRREVVSVPEPRDEGQDGGETTSSLSGAPVSIYQRRLQVALDKVTMMPERRDWSTPEGQAFLREVMAAEHDLVEIWASTDVRHLRSRRVMEKLGMTFERSDDRSVVYRLRR